MAQAACPVHKSSLYGQPSTSSQRDGGGGSETTGGGTEQTNRGAAPDHIDPQNVKGSFYSLLNRKDQVQLEGSERTQQEHHDFWLDRAMTELSDHVLRMTRCATSASSPTRPPQRRRPARHPAEVLPVREAAMEGHDGVRDAHQLTTGGAHRITRLLAAAASTRITPRHPPVTKTPTEMCAGASLTTP